MAIVLFDSTSRNTLYPFTRTRAVAEIRLGILTRKEWWRLVSGQKVYVHSDKYLNALYTRIPQGFHLFIDAAVLPDRDLLQRILLLSEGRSLTDEEHHLIAGNLTLAQFEEIQDKKQKWPKSFALTDIHRLSHPWEIFQWNDTALRAQYPTITKDRHSEKLSKSNTIIGKENIFVEKGVSAEGIFLNASEGPIYIGKNVTIMEGACLRGPIAIGEGAVVKMGAKIYGATSIGPYCTVGGEIKNSVLMGYSNKAHDGYLGDAVLGYWCNVGGGTTNSNIKNTAGSIIITDYQGKPHTVGMKAGFILGDYSRIAINSTINTGSMFGIASNIFGQGFLPKFVPDFSWGTDHAVKYKIEKVLEDTDRWMQLKQLKLSSAEKKVLKYLFEQE